MPRADRQPGVLLISAHSPHRKPGRHGRIGSLALATCVLALFPWYLSANDALPRTSGARPPSSLEAADALGEAIFQPRQVRARPAARSNPIGAPSARAARPPIDPTQWLHRWHARRAAQARSARSSASTSSEARSLDSP